MVKVNLSYFKSIFTVVLCCSRAFGVDYVPLDQPKAEAVIPLNPNRYHLVEYFTAETLDKGEMKLGFEASYAPIKDLMFGIDLLSTAVGAPSVSVKWQVFKGKDQAVAIGLGGSFYNKKTVLWGFYEDHFKELDAKFLKPSVAWTNSLSPKLNLHTYWSLGVGSSHAVLSPKGQRALWESKHPNGDYANRTTKAETDEVKENQNNASETSSSSISNRTLQLQTLTGIQKDVFQITGEYIRENRNKILLSSRVENSMIEKLKANSIRVTAAQQWVFDNFQFRLGVGFIYQVLSGTDLDGENIEDSGVQPATDIDFYWRF